MIQTIEIICKPCRKCTLMKERIALMMECIQQKNAVSYKYQLLHNEDPRAAEKYGYNLNQLPLVIIDGNIEFVGHVKEEALVRKKLEMINKGY